MATSFAGPFPTLKQCVARFRGHPARKGAELVSAAPGPQSVVPRLAVPVEQVGGRVVVELWIQAERMGNLNASIVGEIREIREIARYGDVSPLGT